jgi:hypothetical protein
MGVYDYQSLPMDTCVTEQPGFGGPSFGFAHGSLDERHPVLHRPEAATRIPAVGPGFDIEFKRRRIFGCCSHPAGPSDKMGLERRHRDEGAAR